MSQKHFLLLIPMKSNRLLFAAVNMVNGIIVNGLGDVSMDNSHQQGNVLNMSSGNSAYVHPGSISSTGRQRVSQGTATSTHQAQLIGGGIAPTLFTTSVSSNSVRLLSNILVKFLQKMFGQISVSAVSR